MDSSRNAVGGPPTANTFQKTGFGSCPSPCSIWTTGDYWQETFLAPGLASVDHVRLDLNLTNSLVPGASITFGVFLNSILLGSMDFNQASGPGMFGFDFFFGAIAGTDYALRIEVVSPTVPPGEGSIGLHYDGTSIATIAHTAAVPEPMSMILLGTGLVGIAALRRRRHPSA
jgi:hypothetical protein